jgi:beta-glucosidase
MKGRRRGLTTLTRLSILAGQVLAACQQTFPLEETHPVELEIECLAPEQPMATITAAPGSGFPSAECVERAKQIVAKMSPLHKYGQMFQPDRGTVRDPKDLATFGVGSLLSGGGSAPLQNNPMAWARMVNVFREQSLKSDHGVPVIYGIDAVHGHNNVHGAVIFPHNVGLGATRDPELVERIGRITAKEVLATNIDWTFAPVLAVARDERWGRAYEAFGEAPELPELLGPALIRGLQGSRLGGDGTSVLACAKHYLGDGNTQGGIDQGNSPMTRGEIDSQLLPAYQKAIDAGVGSVMVSYSSVQGIRMHCHGPLLNDTLKKKMGFQGFIVSDWEAVEKLPGNYPEQLSSAINAGVDMVMNPKIYTGFVSTMSSLVPDRISTERVDDAVTRIVAVKCELGMLEPERHQRDRSGNLRMDAELLGEFGSEAHRAVAREAVRKSMVLLKNESGLVPLRKDVEKVHLSGRSADDLGRQCGGWTISWQGDTGQLTDGTTVREALQSALGDTGRVSFSPDGSAVATDAKVAIAVIGERPYAEMNGDKEDLALHSDDVATVKALKATGLPVVVVLISGRPMILGEVGELADAIVAAWLPGSEGSGIADVLLGDFPFSGKLPHTWPRTMAQIPINVGDTNYDPLYPYGFGLTTSAWQPTAQAAPLTDPAHPAVADPLPKAVPPPAAAAPAAQP